MIVCDCVCMCVYVCDRLYAGIGRDLHLFIQVGTEQTVNKIATQHMGALLGVCVRVRVCLCVCVYVCVRLCVIV